MTSAKILYLDIEHNNGRVLAYTYDSLTDDYEELFASPLYCEQLFASPVNYEHDLYTISIGTLNQILHYANDLNYLVVVRE